MKRIEARAQDFRLQVDDNCRLPQPGVFLVTVDSQQQGA